MLLAGWQVDIALTGRGWSRDRLGGCLHTHNDYTTIIVNVWYSGMDYNRCSASRARTHKTLYHSIMIAVDFQCLCE